MKKNKRNYVVANDSDHQKALDATGFWGKQGAGCIFLALDTGRLLFAHRSRYVEQPGTWGTWGGAIDEGENPKQSLAREIKEEAGFTGKVTLEPLSVFSHASGFRYHNFLAVVAKEFKPTLDWENQGYSWVDYGDWPSPLHEGAKLMLGIQSNLATIKRMMPSLNLSKVKVEAKRMTLLQSSATRRLMSKPEARPLIFRTR